MPSAAWHTCAPILVSSVLSDRQSLHEAARLGCSRASKEVLRAMHLDLGAQDLGGHCVERHGGCEGTELASLFGQLSLFQLHCKAFL